MPDVVTLQFDLTPPTEDQRSALIADLNQDDGIHPNEEGARMIAELVADFVKPLLQRSGEEAATE